MIALPRNIGLDAMAVPATRRLPRRAAWRRSGVFALLSALALGGGGAQAAPADATPAHSDLSGVYQGHYHLVLTPIDGSDIPFRPDAAALYKKRIDAQQAGTPLDDGTASCLPPGMPRFMIYPYPLEIIETPTHIVMIAEAGMADRYIWTDGRPHPGPEELYPTYNGHSIGKWEGDTLVIDTVGLNDKGVADVSGIPKSASLHVIEHIRRIAGTRNLEDLITLDDPKTFTRVWTGRTLFDWRPGEVINEYVCENNRNLPDANGVQTYSGTAGK